MPAPRAGGSAPVVTSAHAPSGFGRVLAAEAASNFGSMLSRLAIPWVATLLLDATPWEMGLLLVADIAAGACASLFLGAAVDRSDKRRTMLLADALRALLLGGLALAAATAHLSMAGLLLAAAAGGLLGMAFELARSAWMAQRLAHDELATRNAQLAVASSVSETAAFALGGFLYQGWGAVVALTVDAASYLASALCLRGVPAAPPARHAAPDTAPDASAWGEVREGLVALVGSPAMRGLAALEVLLALAGSLTGTCYMIFVARELGLSPATIGVVAALGGLGALAGAAWAPRLGRLRGSPRALAAGLAVTAIGALCIPLAPWAGAWAVALLVAHQVVGDAGATVQEVHNRTMRQTLVAPHLLARVDGGLRTVGQVAQLAGALAGGLFATWAGVRAGLGLAAGLLVLAALQAWRAADRLES